MKRILTIALVLFSVMGYGQAVLSYRADTIRFYKNGGSAELLLQNSTKDTLGTLVNIGGGKTRFMKSRKLNDSTLIIGLDTLTLPGGSGGGGIDSINLIASTGIRKILDTIKSTYPVISNVATLRAVPSASTNDAYRLKIGGTLRDYLFFPGDNTTPDDGVMAIRSNGGGTYIMQYDYVDPVWFGAIPNDGLDDSPAIIAACNFARLSLKAKRVLFNTVGEYHGNSIVLATKNGTDYDQFALTIEGAMTSLGLGVTITNTNVNAATFLIQKAKGVEIKNIHFKGVGPDFQFSGNYITAQDAQWTAAVGGGTIRSNRKSPGQTAIAIDPFYAIGAFASTILSSSDYYPGLTSWYSNTTYSGSTNINVDGCTMEKLYVGISVGLSGIANAEGIHVNNMYANSIAYFWAAGQLQSRENTITKLYLTFTHTMLAAQEWGSGLGDIPSVNNSNCNYIKYIYDTYGNFTKARINIYGEGIYSLGRSTSNSLVTFYNSTIAFAANNITIDGAILGVAPVVAEGGGIAFENCSILAPSYYSGIPFNNDQVLFTNSYIQGGLPFTTNLEYGQDRIRFENCTQWFGGQINRWHDDRNNMMTDEALFFNRNESFLMPGGKLKAIDGRTFERLGERYDRLPAHLDQYNTGYAVTVNSTTRTMTFTAADPGIFQVNDLIVTSASINNTNDLYAASSSLLGYVSSKAGSVITLSDIPAGVSSTTYQMFILRLPRFINHTLGVLTSGSATITGVIADPGGFAVNDRIKGVGIPDGTYVTGIAGSTITMSMNATASSVGQFSQLYDAEIKTTASDGTFKYVGGNYNYDLLEVIWFTGDELYNRSPFTIASKGRYCINPGKTLLSGKEPYWIRGEVPDPVVASRLTSNTTSLTMDANGLAGGRFFAYRADYAVAGGYGSAYVDFGDYTAAINSGASFNVRTFNNGVATSRLKVDYLGGITLSDLAGSGTRMVVADANGKLSTQAIPGGGGGGGGDVYLANSNTFTGSVQTAPQWASLNSYFYDNGQAHIGNVVGGSYILNFENFGIVSGIPGASFYANLIDATGSQIITSTFKFLGVAGSGTRALITDNNGDVTARAIDASPTNGSSNFVTSDGVYDAIAAGIGTGGGNLYHTFRGQGIQELKEVLSGDSVLVHKTFIDGINSKVFSNGDTTIGYHFFLNRDTVQVQHLVAKGSTPSLSLGAAAGTSPTGASIFGKDMAFKITFTTGSSPTTGLLATITPAVAWNNPVVICTPNSGSYNNRFTAYYDGTDVIFLYVDSALSASTTYSFQFFLIDL